MGRERKQLEVYQTKQGLKEVGVGMVCAAVAAGVLDIGPLISIPFGAGMGWVLGSLFRSQAYWNLVQNRWKEGGGDDDIRPRRFRP